MTRNSPSDPQDREEELLDSLSASRESELPTDAAHPQQDETALGLVDAPIGEAQVAAASDAELETTDQDVNAGQGVVGESDTVLESEQAPRGVATEGGLAGDEVAEPANIPIVVPEEIPAEGVAAGEETSGESAKSDEQSDEADKSSPKASAKAPMSPAKKRLISALRPRATRAQILSALLLGLLGFALVAQLQLSQKDELSGLRQSELVNLLDDVTRRSSELEDETLRLNGLVGELESGTNSQLAAQQAAEENAATQGILSGRLPAEGPGITIGVTEGEKAISASALFNILEELRNAGAEAVEVNGLRMITSSYFTDTDQGVVIDGVVVAAPYQWKAIGDANTMQPALEIPGGAMASIRGNGGEGNISVLDTVEIKSVVEVREPEFARPVD
ncbi:DUF881 domain-containing protein [Timonella senegalensis]|uniref:DUF881 domain-containing protein n=1 Tax=Timonella senegalensis TaxID=1465825 RepID=UPI0028A6CB27|nr:DUF881 domain-containing protein [Timonella senegalensis]